MTSTEKIHEIPSLSPEPIIIIIPDSPEGLCDPTPAGPVAAQPSPPPNVTQGKRNDLEESGTGRIEAPGRARPAARPRVRALGAALRGIPVHVPLVALGSWLTGLCHWAVERLGSAVSVVHNACRDRITAIDCLWFGIRTAQLSCIAGIVGIVGYYVIYPILSGVVMVLAWVGAASAAVAGPLLLTALLVAAVWRMAGRVPASKPATRTVTTDNAAAAVSKAPTRKSHKPNADVSPRTRAQKTTAVASEAPRDVLTGRWVAAMRNPTNRQAQGALDGYVMVDQAVGVTGDPDSHCAAGWLLEVNGDRNHRRATKALERKYGVPLLRKVARMNDSGTSLPRIADYVERHGGRR